MGYQAGSANLWFTDSLQQNVPNGFSKALTWPMAGKTSLALPVDQFLGYSYSEFNAPWGNSEVPNFPFYSPASPNYYIHSGVDIYATPGTQVKAACDGPIKTDTSGTNSSLVLSPINSIV